MQSYEKMLVSDNRFYQGSEMRIILNCEPYTSTFTLIVKDSSTVSVVKTRFLNCLQTKMWLFFCTTGSERKTKRWRSSSGWSWCLWNRSSKSHRVSETLKITRAHHLKETRWLCVMVAPSSLFIRSSKAQETNPGAAPQQTAHHQVGSGHH